MSIRTPDQRVRVFVSSTMQELAAERQAVRAAIESLRLTPVMFELGARPHPPRALYRAYLEQSDVFVGLYGESYGWVPPSEELSGLEDEYALSGDRPKLIYLKMPAPERQPRLDELIARIQRDDSVSYRPFGTADELRTLVADDLAVLLTERFAASVEAPVGPPGSSRIVPLPRPATRLIGRDRDVSRVLDLLGDPDVWMVTIVGLGGIGKSRLALAVGEGARERYPDGISYIDLASLTEPSLVLPTIAESLGVEEQTGTSVGAQLRDRLAEARMLIVLDNMEQLADAAGDLSDLLAATDAPLYCWSPAVAFSKSVGSAYTPLGAGRTHRRSCHSGSGDVLGAGSEHPPQIQSDRRRPRDIWRALSAAGRTAIGLAVFVGSADLEAIEQMTHGEGRLDTLDLIAELVDQSLVQALGEADEPRIGMLATIREFAVERLEASGTADDYRIGRGLLPPSMPSYRAISSRSRPAWTMLSGSLPRAGTCAP